MAVHEFDLVVIGGGPGGYVAAIRAAQLEMKTALVEREHLGGICLNWGCIPTKALLRSGEIFDHLNHLKSFGLTADKPSYDTAAVVKRSRQIASQLSKGVAHLLKKNKVTVIDGQAALAGSGSVEVKTKNGTDRIKAKNIILATGARARQLPGLEADGKLIWTYKEAMVPETMPKSLLVVGSGAIGIEFASFYRSMGVEVTVVEVLDRVLPVEDEEISAFAHKQFEKRGIKLITKAEVKALDKAEDNVTATIAAAGKTERLKVDRVIMAVGIVGNVENLGLEGTKINVDRTHVVIDEWCRTGEPGIYAIGDLCGPPWLAHKASHEGVLCVEKIAGLNDIHPLDVTKIPGCTYCTPQVASVGFTEAAAKKAGHDVKIGRFPFIGNGKAIALGEPEGMVKTVFDAKTGELLGAHMVGAEVTELIQGYVIARQVEATELDLMHTVFPHPTLSEMMHESTLDAYGRAIHF
ncbi:MAG: dihydrolipoyl dehydrogenase [Alphaproteobacteria bacterium]|nr:dihydrolipoyl dehydrogenase [Alphaproteobacteria bacterium]